MADGHGITFAAGFFSKNHDLFSDRLSGIGIIQKDVPLAKKARRKGYAVAIGHDRHLTMQMLKEEIPWLEGQGFQIVSIKELLRNK